MTSRVPPEPAPRRFLLLDRTDPDYPVWLCVWATMASQEPAQLDEAGIPTAMSMQDADQLILRTFTVAAGHRMDLTPASPPMQVWELVDHREPGPDVAD